MHQPSSSGRTAKERQGLTLCPSDRLRWGPTTRQNSSAPDCLHDRRHCFLPCEYNTLHNKCCSTRRTACLSCEMVSNENAVSRCFFYRVWRDDDSRLSLGSCLRLLCRHILYLFTARMPLSLPACSPPSSHLTSLPTTTSKFQRSEEHTSELQSHS